MKTEQVDGHLWAKLVLASSRCLDEKKNIVDALNVFPVPDGDTGTNMSLTLASAARAAQKEPVQEIGEMAKKISYGALMGARGNSGVILSQLFAGFAKAAEKEQALTPIKFAKALEAAVKTAYQAVMNPVEGTILTVSKEAAKAARKAAKKKGCQIADVVEAAYKGSLVTLEKTPQMLPVLKQAGVVDAGGQGLVYIFEGMLRVLKGEEFDFGVSAETELMIDTNNEFHTHKFVGELKYRYCTEFILRNKEKKIELEKIRSFLADKGDCLLVVGNQEAGKIHIHTNHPGKVLEFCTDMGSLHDIKIDNMQEQTEEMQYDMNAAKDIGIICTAVGTGMSEIFKSLGVDAVISGGQTMNPSTQDFIEAIDNIMATEVLLLPNNSNIILAAQQAAKVSEKPCAVVQTKTIPQGIAALMAFNHENELDFNKEKMEEASKKIITIEITYAIRDSEYEGRRIKKDQILGMVNGKLEATGETAVQVVEDTIRRFIGTEHELVTVYYGDDVTEDEARGLLEKLSQEHADVDFELHYGGQPLYFYMISIE